MWASVRCSSHLQPLQPLDTKRRPSGSGATLYRDPPDARRSRHIQYQPTVLGGQRRVHFWFLVLVVVRACSAGAPRRMVCACHRRGCSIEQPPGLLAFVSLRATCSDTDKYSRHHSGDPSQGGLTAELPATPLRAARTQNTVEQAYMVYTGVESVPARCQGRAVRAERVQQGPAGSEGSPWAATGSIACSSAQSMSAEGCM